MPQKKQISTIIATAFVTAIVIGVILNTWYQKKQLAMEPQQIQIFESYDCDKLTIKNKEISGREDPIMASLEYLEGPGGYGSIAAYSKGIKIKDGIAYIDWPNYIKDFSNIDTSCAISAFFNPIDKTLTQYKSINRVIHSLEGSVNDFYERMGLACPEGIVDCEETIPKI